MIAAKLNRMLLLRSAPWLLYASVLVAFACLTPKFLSAANFANILVQSAPIAIVAVGMTFVLLTAGIDLSVGSVIFLAAAVGGSLVVRLDWPVAGVLPVMLLVGLAWGAINGSFITRLRLSPFIVTLASLFVARGLGLWITETRAINLPESFLSLAAARWMGVPFPIWLLVVVAAAAQFTLSFTPFGRQLYAVGADANAARKAGIEVDRMLLTVYVVCAGTAAIGAIIALAQLAAVSPNMGQGRELEVIAAAVLGGASLFGGRGTAVGAVLGAVLVETVRNGLNLVDADPYIYPLIIGAIIFVAVLIDSLSHQQLARLTRRKIRPLDSTPAAKRRGVHGQ
ncbi:MAG: ABC transporter permease [Planctomycetota bacterium]